MNQQHAKKRTKKHAKKRAVFKIQLVGDQKQLVGQHFLVGQQLLVGHQTVSGSPKQLDVRIDRDLRHLPEQLALCGHAG